MNEKAMGGTELMFQELMSRTSSNLFDRISIFNYLPNADFEKITVFWNQLSFDQQAVQFLNDYSYVEKIDYFVFVSDWQSEMYRKIYNIPGYKTKVIKNACIGVTPNLEKKQDKIKISYTSTPWRGLDVLLDAWEMLDLEDCELHVFSSTKIYGKDFAISQAGNYQDLFDRCSNLKNVIYRDFVSNENLRKELPEFDILAYPNTFEETSCIAVIEALSAGLRVVTSNLGALPETTEGWARMYPYLVDKQKHAEVFSKILIEEIEKVKKGELKEHLDNQIKIYNPRWSWNERIKEWNKFLTTLSQGTLSTSEQILENTLQKYSSETLDVGS